MPQTVRFDDLVVLILNDRIRLRTQGSTKLFKSVQDKITTSNINVSVGSGSLFALLPDPTTCFPGSRFTQQLEFILEKGASLVMVDWYGAGRQVRNCMVGIVDL